jgi:hypothetical protein
MSLVISKVFTYDTDAGDYIQRVEGASGDNAALEPATRQAINNFVIGCKQDGIWNAIKASCILSGARTLAGALQPLAGTAPTNNGPFVTGDYNRKTGLVGDGTSKYLNSNRNNNVDPQNSKHLAVNVTAGPTTNPYPGYIGVQANQNGSTLIGVERSTAKPYFFNNNISQYITTSAQPATGFLGTSRSGSSQFNVRFANSSVTVSLTSQTPYNADISVFRESSNTLTYSNARLAFYSIGESLDLALLDARVTALITAFGVAIP